MRGKRVPRSELTRGTGGGSPWGAGLPVWGFTVSPHTLRLVPGEARVGLGGETGEKVVEPEVDHPGLRCCGGLELAADGCFEGVVALALPDTVGEGDEEVFEGTVGIDLAVGAGEAGPVRCDAQLEQQCLPYPFVAAPKRTAA